MPEKKRTLKIAVAVMIFILCLPISSAAKDETLGSDLGNAVDTLPQGIKDSLPEGFEEELSSPEELSKLFGVDYLFSLSAGLFKSALSAALKTFASIAAAIVISALVSNIASAFSSGGAGVQTVNLATSLCISSCAYIMIWSHVRGVIDFSGNISTFMKALTVAMGAVYTSVGELGSAGVHGAWVFSLTTVTEELCSGLLLPLMQISFSATLVSSISSGVNINRFVQTLRNVFASFLVFFMTVISVILSFQTVIAHTSDSVTMRGVRYAVSHSVPVIGALVSDSARTLATGFSLIKNSVGFFGIAVIVILSLYPLVGLVASKWALQLSSSFSSILSEDKACVFLDESVKMINFLIAVVIMLDVAFIFCISIFALLPAAGA